MLQGVCHFIGASSWNVLVHFAVSEIDPASTTKRVSRCAIVLLPWTVLEVVLTWSWHILLNVLIGQVGFSVHANLGSFRDP